MSTLLRIFFIVSMALLAYALIRKPRAFRVIGRRARVVAYAYIAAIVIGAVIRIAGWGT